MKIINLTLSLIIATSLTVSCVSRSLMLDVPLVSATKGPKPKGGYRIGKEVKSSFCAGDKAISTNDSTVGMIDEVVFRAQKSANANYIAEVSIYEVNKLFSNPCYELRGKAAN